MMTITMLLSQKGGSSVDIDRDTHGNILFLSTGSTVAVQHKDGGPWVYGKMVGLGSDDNNGRSYKIWDEQDRTCHHQDKETCQGHPVTAEDYFRKEVNKNSVTKADDSFNKCLDVFT